MTPAVPRLLLVGPVCPGFLPMLQVGPMIPAVFPVFPVGALCPAGPLLWLAGVLRMLVSPGFGHRLVVLPWHYGLAPFRSVCGSGQVAALLRVPALRGHGGALPLGPLFAVCCPSPSAGAWGRGLGLGGVGRFLRSDGSLRSLPSPPPGVRRGLAGSSGDGPPCALAVSIPCG